VKDNYGLGVMIRMLSSREESVHCMTEAIGKEISTLSYDDKALHISFIDGTKIKLSDEGQSCCEHRYMRTDDDLTSFVGGILIKAEINDAPSIDDEWGEEHEVQFLIITTSKGSFTMANHNEHNGYYGGFSIECSKE